MTVVTPEHHGIRQMGDFSKAMKILRMFSEKGQHQREKVHVQIQLLRNDSVGKYPTLKGSTMIWLQIILFPTLLHYPSQTLALSLLTLSLLVTDYIPHLRVNLYLMTDYHSKT
jgi:hypothetical protein